MLQGFNNKVKYVNKWQLLGHKLSVKAEARKQIKRTNHGCVKGDTVFMCTCRIGTDNVILHSYANMLCVSSRERP